MKSDSEMSFIWDALIQYSIFVLLFWPDFSCLESKGASFLNSLDFPVLSFYPKWVTIKDSPSPTRVGS